MVSNKDIPGPGTYDYGKTTDGAKFSIGGKHPDPSRFYVPGPGEYDRRSEFGPGKHGGAGISLSKAPKGGFKASDSPGPGNYELKSTIDQHGYKFGVSPRPPLAKPSEYDNYYNIPAAVPNAPIYLLTEEQKRRK
jgi:hypothetical protein